MNGFRPSMSIASVQGEAAQDETLPREPLVAGSVGTREAASPSAPEPSAPAVTERPAATPQAQEAPPLEITATPVVETPEPAQETVQAAKKTEKPASKPAAAKAPQKAQGPVWRVQVGAYGSKQAANEIVSKLAKSGYTATVYSGTKYHKVWVQAGNTRQAAEAVASRLKKAGYPGSYVVPPASR